MLSRMAPSSPPVKRTLHLLKTPDILLANDSRLSVSNCSVTPWPASAAASLTQPKSPVHIFASYSPILVPCGTCPNPDSATSLSAAKDVVKTIPAPVGTMPDTWIVARCPLCGERRRYRRQCRESESRRAKEDG